MLTKKEQKLPMYDREFLKEPRLQLEANLELAVEDLDYCCRTFKGKKFVKFVKETSDRAIVILRQIQTLDTEMRKTELRQARLFLKWKC